MTARPSHTPEPWYYDGSWICALLGSWLDDAIMQRRVGGERIVTVDGSGDNDDPNGYRIVACVNHCAGLDPSALPALIEAAEASTVALDKYAERPVDANDDPRSWHALQDLTRSVEAIRAALAACRGSK